MNEATTNYSNPEMTKMLELSDGDFKVSIIKEEQTSNHKHK
jgi:hypothetical protein